MSAPAAALNGPYVDLHAHTTASDGRATPEELIAAAVAADLQAIAITDHDTLDGLPRAEVEAARTGITLVHGIELSTVDGNREVHLLGLHLTQVTRLQERLISVRAARVDRAEEMVRRLTALGMPITMEMVQEQAAGGAVGRPHVARALIAGGHVREMREAFDRWLGDGKPACVGKERVELADGIRMIHEAGGVAVWAHPQADGNRERIGRFAGLGLDGVEVRHPSHSSDDIARIATLCDFFGLLKSGGSDWHGATDGFRPLGCMQVPAPWMDAQLARAAKWRSEPAGVAAP